MRSTTHTLDNPATFPLRVLGNCYRQDKSSGTGYTLVLLHATGLHKETWEPTIEALLALSEAALSSNLREIWSIECPNHGQSALLNEDELQGPPTNEWNAYTYARAVHAFLSSKPGGENLLDHKLIVAGHSIGGNAALHLQTIHPCINFEAVILMDATIGPHTRERDHMAMLLTHSVWTKPDVWRSRKDALKFFSAMPGYKHWDKRALELYVKYALRAHPAGKYPPPHRFPGVTLACSKDNEAACYRTVAPEEASGTLQHLYAQGMPVHFIFSTQDEFGAHSLKEEQLKSKGSHGPASIHWIERSKHLFVQQFPGLTANALWDCITVTRSHRSLHKL